MSFLSTFLLVCFGDVLLELGAANNEYWMCFNVLNSKLNTTPSCLSKIKFLKLRWTTEEEVTYGWVHQENLWRKGGNVKRWLWLFYKPQISRLRTDRKNICTLMLDNLKKKTLVGKMLWDWFQSKTLKLSKTQLDIQQHPIGRQTQCYNIQILSFGTF